MRNKKTLIILTLLLFLASLAFASSYLYFKNINQPPQLPTTSPTPQPLPTATPTPSSPYATDSALLQTKNKLKHLEKKLDSLDLVGTELLPPLMDFEVELEE